MNKLFKKFRRFEITFEKTEKLTFGRRASVAREREPYPSDIEIKVGGPIGSNDHDLPKVIIDKGSDKTSS